MVKKAISPRIRIKGEILDFLSIVEATNVVLGEGWEREGCGSS